jgi:hypothetical protein
METNPEEGKLAKKIILKYPLDKQIEPIDT